MGVDQRDWIRGLLWEERDAGAGAVVFEKGDISRMLITNAYGTECVVSRTLIPSIAEGQKTLHYLRDAPCILIVSACPPSSSALHTSYSSAADKIWGAYARRNLLLHREEPESLLPVPKTQDLGEKCTDRYEVLRRENSADFRLLMTDIRDRCDRVRSPEVQYMCTVQLLRVTSFRTYSQT